MGKGYFDKFNQTKVMGKIHGEMIRKENKKEP